ncbi:MAG: hypothetical protein M3445_01895 [Actinomycetota bacterium]|nr:hypothetical protein [Actinomycetota bacterium]
MSKAEPPRDLGRLIYAVRPTPGLLATAITLAIVVVVGAFVYLTNERSLLYASTGMASISALIAVLAASGLCEQHRVYEHAVVVGFTWPRNRPYVIPISTIDPTTVTVHRRANMIARRLKSGGLPTMRMAVYSTRAVSFVGLTYQKAHPTSNPAEQHRRQLLQAAVTGTLMPRGDRSLWALGVRRPRPLLDALEAAFTADGRPAPGVAAHAAANPVIEPSGQPATRS